MKGFALVLAILLLLILTLFGASIILVAQNYYGATKSLLEREKARLACESARIEILNHHNMDNGTPRYLFAPSNWNGKALVPFYWGGYRIDLQLEKPWNPFQANLAALSARKGPYRSEQMLELRQRRLEDFAIYSDLTQTLPGPSLLDGVVFVRGELDLAQPGVRFRDIIQADVQPPEFASYKIKSLQNLDYPPVDAIFTVSTFYQEAQKHGIVIASQNALFWNADHYELDLDLLRIEPQKQVWKITYNGLGLGTVTSLHIYFDRDLSIRQTNQAIPFLPASGATAPLYITSASNITLKTSIQPLQGTIVSPLCVVAANQIVLGSQLPLAARFGAMLIALTEANSSIVIDPGGIPVSAAEKQTFIEEALGSAFLLEQEKKSALLQALDSGQKIVWFRGSVILKSALQTSPDLAQLHFQASSDQYPFLSSLPFITVVRGSTQWQ